MASILRGERARAPGSADRVYGLADARGTDDGARGKPTGWGWQALARAATGERNVTTSPTPHAGRHGQGNEEGKEEGEGRRPGGGAGGTYSP